MADKTAHAEIDWKRTTHVCMDINCECGEHSHFDGYEGASPEYVYCIHCKGVNRIGSQIVLQEEELKFGKRGPHASLQWKGTHVYMQAHCTCGLEFAANGDFKYDVECQCGKSFRCDPGLSITKLSAEEAAKVAYVTPQEDILDMINEEQS